LEPQLGLLTSIDQSRYSDVGDVDVNEDVDIKMPR